MTVQRTFDLRTASFVGAVVLAAVAAGAAVTYKPTYALVACAAFATAVAVARVGTYWIALAAAAFIPWAVVYSDYAPHGLRTTLAGVVGVALLVSARPLAANRGLIWAVIVLSSLIVISAITGGAEAHLEAERMLLFPIMVLALSGAGAPVQVAAIRRSVLLSSGAALAGQIILSRLGYVKASSYYGVGENLGLASRPHELAFLGTMTACGALLVFRRGWVAFAVFGVSSYVIVDSGVRTGVLAIAAFMGAKFLSNRRRGRDVFLVAAGAVVILKSGAITVLLNRFNPANSHGGGITSHRSEIWANAWHHFSGGGIFTWLTGTGLGSVLQFSAADLGLGDRGPSHSDIIAVGIQLGALGLLAYAMIWVWFLRRLEYAVALVPVAIFAFGNGLIDRTDAMVFALLIAGSKAYGQTTNHLELPSL